MFRVFTRSKTQPKKPIFYGWWIVAAGSVSQAYTSGTFWQGFGAFFDPIVAQFGWSRAITSAAISLQRTESGMISPFVGYFIDKLGPRTVMIAGIIVTGLGFVLLSQIQSLWQFYGAFILITLGLSFGTFLVVTTTVANWFIIQRSRAMAITSAGSALGGFLVPVIIWLIGVTDWRTTLLIIGVGFWVTGIPVAMLMKSRPEEYGMLPDGASPDQDAADTKSGQAAAIRQTEVHFTAMQALASKTFWQMTLAMGTSQFLMSASIHQIPAMTSFGISRTTAGLMILGVSIVSMTGRLGSGFLGDLLDKRKVIAVAFASQFIGTIIFALSTTEWHLLGFVVFWGFGFGASIPVRFSLIADYFGRKHYGSIMGAMLTASTVFGVIGPVLVGWMYDLRGNYREPFLLMALSVLISIPLVLTLTKPAPPQQAKPA